MKPRITLLVATQNRKKLEEIRAILKGLPVDVSSLSDLKRIPRIVENGKTFKENAAIKALAAARASGMLSMGEDSGLCVDALGGKPGVYSARFSGKAKDDGKNNAKVLRLLRGLPLKERRCHYVCAVAIADRSGVKGVVEGTCSGFIGYEPKGTSGFGYDPLFIVPGHRGKTFAQLGPRIKHRISHRYRALKKVKQLLQKNIVESR